MKRRGCEGGWRVREAAAGTSTLPIPQHRRLDPCSLATCLKRNTRETHNIYESDPKPLNPNP